MLSTVGISDGALAAHDGGYFGVGAIDNWPPAGRAFPDADLDRAIVEDLPRGDLRIPLVRSGPWPNRAQIHRGCPDS